MNPYRYFRTLQQQIYEWIGDTTSPIYNNDQPPTNVVPSTVVPQNKVNNNNTNPSISLSSSTTPSSPLLSLLPTLEINHPDYYLQLQYYSLLHSTNTTTSSKLSSITHIINEYNTRYTSLNGLLIALIKEGKLYSQQEQQQQQSISSSSMSSNSESSSSSSNTNSSIIKTTNPALLSVILHNGIEIEGILVYIDNENK